MIHRLPRLSLTATVAALLTLTPATAAAAADDPLAVSFDGVSFASQGRTPLIEGTGALVPGSERASRVWFRNTTADAGVLTVYVDDISAPEPDLADAVAVSLRAPDGAVLGSVGLGTPADCAVLPGPVAVPAGGTVAADIVVAVDALLGERPGDSGTDGVNASTSFHVRAVLSDAATGGPGDTVCAGELPEGARPTAVPAPPASGPQDSWAAPGDGLALTGAALPVGAALAGATLTALGLTLAARRRRRADG